MRRRTKDKSTHDLTGKLARYFEGLSHRSLALEALRAGEFREAEQYFRLAMSCMGRRADLTAYLCGLYVRTDRHDRCADEMSLAVKDNDGEPSNWRKLAQSQWRSARREDALMTLVSALRKFPQNSELTMQLGLFHAAEHQFEQARKYFESAARSDCTNADMHYYLGLCHASLSDVHAAARSFQRAWELRPSDMMFALQLSLSARAVCQSGKPVVIRLPESDSPPETSHVRQLASYVQKNTDFVDAFLALPPGDVDEKLFAMLANVLQMALSQHGGYADLHMRLSRVMQRLDRFDSAVEHAGRAVEINPKYVQAQLQLGRLYYQSGQNVEAVSHMQQAIQSGADWPDIHCFAGELMLRCEMPDKASRHFHRALELKNNYPRAARALKSLAA